MDSVHVFILETEDSLQNVSYQEAIFQTTNYMDHFSKMERKAFIKAMLCAAWYLNTEQAEWTVSFFNSY